MKQYFSLYLMMILLLGTLLSLSSCEPDDPDDLIDDDITEASFNTMSFNLNGGSYSNKYVDMDNFFDQKTRVGFVDSLGGYIEAFTISEFDGGTVVLEFRVPGAKADTVFYEASDVDFFGDERKEFNFEFVGNQLKLKNINILITEYGEVGERVKGIFNAQLYDFTAGTSPELVYMNDGIFDFKRTQ